MWNKRILASGFSAVLSILRQQCDVSKVLRGKVFISQGFIRGANTEEKGERKDVMVGWHHQLNGHEFEQTPGDHEGQQSMECGSPWGYKAPDMTEQLHNNNTEEDKKIKKQRVKDSKEH